MTLLFHGSNVAIEQIDLSKSKRGKDFGQGFYLNTNSEQAMVMAVRTTRFLNQGQPTLSYAIQYFFGTAHAIKLLKRIEL